MAFYTRTIGAALFISFVLWFCYQRRFKAAFLLSGITLAAVLPWFYWVSKNAPATDSLVSVYYSSYSSWFLTEANPISKGGKRCRIILKRAAMPTTLRSSITHCKESDHAA